MPSYYNQKNLSLPLDLILLENGYSYKKEKCSRNHLTMKNENEDLIIITRSINGHYLYFNPLNDYDKGNIYSFCKNRGVKIDDLLDKDKIKSLDIKDLKHNIKPSELDKRSIEILNIFKEELQDLVYDKPHFFGAKRLIDDESLKGFHLIKQDNYHNICIPTYTFKEYKNLQTSEGNVISFNQCGFMKYLQYPIKKENALIKQLCYGKKGLEILKSKDIKQADIKNIILCESIIDSLSLYELGGFKSEDTLLCSTNGQITQSHFETLNYLSKMSENSIIVLGFDNDKKGQNFTQKAKEALKEHKIELKKPVLKDFNDDLMAFKLLNLNKDFDKKDLELAVETKLNEPIRYFLKNHSTILPEARGKYLNKASFTKDKLMYFVHKIDGFVDDKELNKSLNLCKKMQAYEDKNLKRSR